MVASVRLDPLSRRMLRFRALLPLLVAMHASAAESTSGQTEAEHVALRYSGAAGCPSEADFIAQVMARVRRPMRFGSSEGSVRMGVTLSSAGGQSTGKLEVEQATGEPTRRDFTAESCAEVGSALALVAALALDPNARTEPIPTSVESEPTPEQSPQTLVPPPPPPPPVFAKKTTPLVPPTPAPRSLLVAWVGPAAGVLFGEAPEPLGLVGLSLGFRLNSARPVTPSLQLTPLFGTTGTTGPTSALGEFSWSIARVEGCPLSFPLAAHLRLEPCAALDLGRLSALGRTDAIAVPLTKNRWWVAPGTTLSLHLGYVGWFARLGVLVLFPVTRDEFVFSQPNRTVHQADSVVLGASLALGFQWGTDQMRAGRP
jgi:hypothetical protein